MYGDYLLQSEAVVQAFLGTLDFPKVITDYVYKQYFPAKVKRGVVSHTIVSDTKVNHRLMKHDEDKKFKRERRIVSGLVVPDNIIINIY